MIMYQSAWLNLEPDFINHHSMQIAIHLSAHFNLIESDNYQKVMISFCYNHEAMQYEEKPC